jgi:hypothetical protein
MSIKFLPHIPLKVWPIILLPALLAIGFILHFSVDVPFWDDWHTPGLVFEHIINGSVKFEDFFSQQNQHRMLFPKLIFVAVAFTLGWHVTIFMVLSWFCVLLSFLIVIKLLQSTTEEHPFMFVFIAFLLGALLFSPSQWENQLWGIQLAIFIPPFCLALSLLLQSTLKSYGLKAVSIALLSIISTFSFANGMVVWLLAFPFVRTLLTEEWKTSPYREKIKIVSWTTVYIVLAVATIKFYFWDYRSNGIHQFFNVVLQHPGLGFNYFTAWLGSPLRYAREVHSVIIVGRGILFLVIVSFIAIWMKWKNSSDNAVLASCYPWICFILYGILSGLAITAGRARYGLDYALSSRHTTHSLWIIIAIVGVFYTLWDYEKNRQRIATNVAFGILMGVISLLTVWSWFGGYRSMQTASLRSQQNLLTLRLLDEVPSNPLVNRIDINPDLVRRLASTFIKHDILNIDQIGDWLKEKVQAPDGQDAGWFTVSSNENENKINVSGWAMLPGKGVPADFVVLAKKDQSGNIEIVTGLTNRIKRPDVVEEKHNPKLLLSGFEDRLDNTHIDGNQFLMFAVDLNNRRLYGLSQRR